MAKAQSQESQQDRVDRVIAAVNKGAKGSAHRLSAGTYADVKEAVPFGVAALDRYVLGVGGLAAGRVSELYSEEGAGKTSLLMAAMAGVQRMGGVAILAETEHALDSPRARVFGVNLDEVVLLHGEHIIEVGSRIEDALKALKGEVPCLVGWDSVAATRSKEEAEKGLPEKDAFDKRAKEFSQVMRVINPLVARTRTHLCLINQVRANVGVLFGDKFTTPCGKAIKFHASVRLQIFGGKSIKDAAGQHLGKDITVMAMKNKICTPFRKARVRLMYATGFDDAWSILNHAKALKLVEPRSQDLAAARAALDAADWCRAGLAVGAADEDITDDEGLDEDGL